MACHPQKPLATAKGSAIIFKVGDNIASKASEKKIDPPPLAYLGVTKQNNAWFIIIVMTCKSLPTPNETMQPVSEWLKL